MRHQPFSTAFTFDCDAEEIVPDTILEHLLDAQQYHLNLTNFNGFDNDDDFVDIEAVRQADGTFKFKTPEGLDLEHWGLNDYDFSKLEDYAALRYQLNKEASNDLKECKQLSAKIKAADWNNEKLVVVIDKISQSNWYYTRQGRNYQRSHYLKLVPSSVTKLAYRVHQIHSKHADDPSFDFDNADYKYLTARVADHSQDDCYNDYSFMSDILEDMDINAVDLVNDIHLKENCPIVMSYYATLQINDSSWVVGSCETKPNFSDNELEKYSIDY